MDVGDTPPIIIEPTPPTAGATIARWRWWIHLLILTALPVTVGALGILHRAGTNALLPSKISGLLLATVEQVLIFAVPFTVAWVASRVNGQQL